jgi:hypothetical protein
LEREEFLKELAVRPPDELAAHYLAQNEVAAFETADEYLAFKDLVRCEIGQAQSIAIVGTGNWRFSLNPEKNFKSFDEKSDIDIAVISPDLFTATWKELRRVHRFSWYRIPLSVQQQLRRNGENVYCGFVSPTWIPDKRSELRYQHKSTLNRLSNRSPAQREVKMMYFKEHAEAVDYYKRGFEIARRKVNFT